VAGSTHVETAVVVPPAVLRFDPRTRLLLEAPIAPTLLRLATPNVLVMFVQASLGAGRRADADALALHALAIAGGFGLVFTLAVLGGGRWLYAAMGGQGPSLAAALTYSNIAFSGAILIWVFNSLANVIRGTGNMAIPAAVTSVGAAALIPLSPCLIFGWGPLPRLGVAGARLRWSSTTPSGVSSSPAIYGWGGASSVCRSVACASGGRSSATF